MPKALTLFASGSCRLVTTIGDGRGKITPIHSMFHNFVGIHFLGKLHNTKQHIQFLQWIRGDLELPESILASFLTSYSTQDGLEEKSRNPLKRKAIREAFHTCDVFVFEICSLKLYEKDGYQVQHELTNDYTCTLQSETDFYTDLKRIRDLLPVGKKLIFQTHFRLHIVYTDNSKLIEKRELVYKGIEKFCSEHENVYLFDPSPMIQKDRSLLQNDTHFNERGHAEAFRYLYENFLHSD